MAGTDYHYARDLYAELGVSREATQQEIKKQYKRMAAKLHPDRIPEGPEQQAAEAKFKEMKEAYEILSDPSRRSDYNVGRADYERSMSRRSGFSTGQRPEPQTPSPSPEGGVTRSSATGNGPSAAERNSVSTQTGSEPHRAPQAPPPPEGGGTRSFAAGNGPAVAAHSRGWGLKGWLVGGAVAAWVAVEGYYALKKFMAPTPPTPAAVLAAHKPSDPTAPGSVFMTRLQMGMTTQPIRSSLQTQLGITEAEAARIQKVFMGVRDVNNPNAETPYDKIAKAMKSDKDSVTIDQPLKDGKTAKIHVDGKQVSVAVVTGDLKGTKSEIVFPHSESIKAAFAPDRRAADLKAWDSHADRVSGKAIQYPLSLGAATAFIGNSVWKQYDAFERQMAPRDPTKGVFDDSKQFSEFWRKVLRDRAMLETGFSARGDVKQEYTLTDGTKASIHITPENVEFERVDPGTGNKRSFKQETALADRLSLSEPPPPTATRSVGAKPSPG